MKRKRNELRLTDWQAQNLANYLAGHCEYVKTIKDSSSCSPYKKDKQYKLKGVHILSKSVIVVDSYNSWNHTNEIDIKVQNLYKPVKWLKAQFGDQWRKYYGQ